MTMGGDSVEKGGPAIGTTPWGTSSGIAAADELAGPGARIAAKDHA